MVIKSHKMPFDITVLLCRETTYQMAKLHRRPVLQVAGDFCDVSLIYWGQEGVTKMFMAS